MPKDNPFDIDLEDSNPFEVADIGEPSKKKELSIGFSTPGEALAASSESLSAPSKSVSSSGKTNNLPAPEVTRLNPNEERQFTDWYTKVSSLKGLGGDPDNKEQYYDYRGFFKNEPKLREEILKQSKEAHFIDKYKLPGHPTFSNESIYSSKVRPGGEWSNENGEWVFRHSPYTAKYSDRTDNYLKGTGERAINPYEAGFPKIKELPNSPVDRTNVALPPIQEKFHQTGKIEPKPEHNPNAVETGLTGLAGGVLKAASAFANIPNAIFDYAIAPIIEAGSPTDIAQPRGLTKKNIEDVRTRIQGNIPLTKTIDTVSDKLNTKANKILENNKSLEGKTMIEEMAQGNVGNAAKIFTAQLGEFAPIIAASIYAPGAVAPTIFSQNIQNLEGREDLTAAQKSGLGGALSTIQAVLIPAGASGITSAFAPLAEKIGVEAATKKLAETYTQAILRNSGRVITPALKGAAIGASMDLASQVAQNYIDPEASGEINWETVGDAAILFGLPAGASHLASRVHQGIIDKKARTEARANEEKINALEEDLNNPDISPETKDILIPQHEELVNKTNDLIVNEGEKLVSIPEENQKKIAENTVKINTLEHSIENEPLKNKEQIQKAIDDLHKENRLLSHPINENEKGRFYKARIGGKQETDTKNKPQEIIEENRDIKEVTESFPNTKVKIPVYHRTNSNINKFELDKTKSKAFYFNNIPDKGDFNNILGVALDIKKPAALPVNFSSNVGIKEFKMPSPHKNSITIETLENEGYDSAIGFKSLSKFIAIDPETASPYITDVKAYEKARKEIENNPINYNDIDEYVVFSPKQIKILTSEKETASDNNTKKEKAEINDQDKSNLESIGKEVGKNFREIQNVYTKYDGTKPLSEITVEDFKAAEKKRQESKVSSKPAEIGGDVPAKFTGVKHAETERLRQEFGMPEYERSPKKQAELESEAQEALSKGYNVERLLKKLDSGEVPTPKEHQIMINYLAGMSEKVSKNPTDADLIQLKRAIEAFDKAGSLAGSTLAQRRGLKQRDESLASYFVQEMENNRDAPLTEEQKTVVKREYEDISKAREEYEDKIKKLQEENDKLRAESVIKEAKKTGSKKSKGDYAAERKQIVDDIKEKLKKLHASSQVTIIPYANELVTIAPNVAKLVKNYVQDGVTRLEDLTKIIHRHLTDGIPDITEKDVRDLIAGKYNEKKKTRSELSKNIFELKQEAKLINKIEELQNGVEPKTEKGKIEKNQKLEDLRKQIKGHDLTKIKDYKNRVEGQIGKLEEELKQTTITEPEKNELKLDAEAKKLRDTYLRLKQERQQRLLKQEYENRTLLQKIQHQVLDAANIPRTLKASFDFSAPLRQGLLATVGHPKTAMSAFKEMFKQFASKEKFDTWLNDVKEDPRYPIAKESGLYISDPNDLNLMVREEAFMSKLAEKVPGIKASERAYVGFLNKMRWDLFNNMTQKFIEQGQTFENSPKLYKSLARYVNNATGRGDLPKALRSLQPVLNATLFSPRLLSSRLSLLTDFANPKFYKNTPPEVRKIYFKDMAFLLGTIYTVLQLAELSGAEVEYDPRSTDFAKIKVGDTRYDISGGFQQPIRAGAQIATGQTKSAMTGKMSTLDGKGQFGRDRYDVAETFLRSKASPLVGTALDIRLGRNVVGEPVTPESVAENLFMPLIISDLIDAWKEQGVKSLGTVGIPATFGVGVSTYKPRHDKYKK